MRAAIIDRTEGKWIDAHEIDFPRDSNGYPFWATIIEHGYRRRELVVITSDHGLCYTSDVYGESYDGTVTGDVTHWMPLNVPLCPA